MKQMLVFETSGMSPENICWQEIWPNRLNGFRINKFKHWFLHENIILSGINANENHSI